MSDFKKKVEAILFSTGKRMTAEEIAKLCHTSADNVEKQLKVLKDEYDAKDSSMIITHDGQFWKLTVRDEFSSVVSKLVADTELTKSVMETLAVIAWKAPVLQSDVIKIRTNKAYDHLSELENGGFITRAKHGRTKIIKLTEQFFNYFDVRNSQQVKETFNVSEEQMKLIEEKIGESREESDEQPQGSAGSEEAGAPLTASADEAPSEERPADEQEQAAQSVSTEENELPKKE